MSIDNTIITRYLQQQTNINSWCQKYRIIQNSTLTPYQFMVSEVLDVPNCSFTNQDYSIHSGFKGPYVC